MTAQTPFNQQDGRMTGQDDLSSEEPKKILSRSYDLKSPEEARELYRDWAISYDQHLQQGLRYIGPASIADVLAGTIEDRTALVLDVGCGTGLVAEYLVGHGFTVIDGLDFSPEMLAVARGKAVYRKLIEVDLNAKMDIAEKVYDAAISCGTFTHGHVKANALDEILRVLKPGACFACTVHRDIWESAGFGSRLSALQEAGTAVLERVTEQPYYENAPAEGRFCLIRRL